MSLLKYRKYTFQGFRTIKVPTVVALVNGAGHPLDAADALTGVGSVVGFGRV